MSLILYLAMLKSKAQEILTLDIQKEATRPTGRNLQVGT